MTSEVHTQLWLKNPKGRVLLGDAGVNEWMTLELRAEKQSRSYGPVNSCMQRREFVTLLDIPFTITPADRASQVYTIHIHNLVGI
jgi:hypothetical protein